MAISWTAAASPTHFSGILDSRGCPEHTLFRNRNARTTGTAIIRMGNQLSRISPTAMSPKAPATMAILVREKSVRKVLNR